MMLLAPAVCLSASPPSAQAPAAAAPQRPAADPAPAATAKPGEAAAPSAVEPQGYSYDRDGRRDPFVSLLRRGTDMTRNTSGTRPPGLAGLATGEVTLSGI